jgi:ABC-type transport system substrate-binding protein
LFVWWNCNNPPPAACDNLVNIGGFNDPVINEDLQKGRVETDAAKRQAYYEDLNRQFSKGLYNVWLNWGVWSVATSPKVHGVFGPPLPDGSSPNTGLAAGHWMLGLFITR